MCDKYEKELKVFNPNEREKMGFKGGLSVSSHRGHAFKMSRLGRGTPAHVTEGVYPLVCLFFSLSYPFMCVVLVISESLSLHYTNSV